MLDICLLFCFATVIFWCMHERSFLNPLSLFLTIWIILLAFQKVELFGLYSTSEKTYESFFYGFLFFTIGIMCSKKWTKYNSISRRGNNELVLNRRLLYLGCYFCIVIYMFTLIFLLPTILSGGLAEIRAMNQDADSDVYARMPGIESAIRTLFVYPFTFAVLPISAIEIIKPRKDLKLVTLVLIIIVLRVFTEGGRVVMAYWMLHVLLAYKFCGQSNYLSKFFKSSQANLLTMEFAKKYRKKMKSIIVVVFIIGIIAIFFATLSRSGEDANIHMYFYLAMQGQMYEIWADTVDHSHLLGCGLGSLNGFFYPFIYIYKNLFGYLDFPGYYGQIVKMIQETDSEWVTPSQYGRANAFVSLFWFFYLDGRIVGIIIGMFIYGFVCGRFYYKTLLSPNDQNICWTILVIQGLIFSMVRLQFANVMYAWGFIYIWLAYRKIKVN